MTARTNRNTDSDLQIAQYLTIATNLAFVLAFLALVAGLALDLATVVLAVLGAFALVAAAFVVAHVVLHRRVAATRGRGPTKSGTVGGALGLIRTNILLYGAFLLVGFGLAVYFGYV